MQMLLQDLLLQFLVLEDIFLLLSRTSTGRATLTGEKVRRT